MDTSSTGSRRSPHEPPPPLHLAFQKYLESQLYDTIDELIGVRALLLSSKFDEGDVMHENDNLHEQVDRLQRIAAVFDMWTEEIINDAKGVNFRLGADLPKVLPTADAQVEGKEGVA